MSFVSSTHSAPPKIEREADEILRVIDSVMKLYENTEHAEHIHQHWPSFAIDALKGEPIRLTADKEKEVCDLSSQLLSKISHFVGRAKYFHEEFERKNSAEVTKQRLLRASAERDKWTA